MAFHRRGAVYDTSIKNKEYCAMGLPFIMASNDRSFPADFPFCYNILPDESLFDIGKIIEWFRTLERSHPDYKQKMFRFAESTLSMEQYYEKILEC